MVKALRQSFMREQAAWSKKDCLPLAMHACLLSSRIKQVHTKDTIAVDRLNLRHPHLPSSNQRCSSSAKMGAA